MNTEETHLLADMEINLVPGKWRQAILNYLIDITLFYSFIVGVIFISIALNPASVDAG